MRRAITVGLVLTLALAAVSASPASAASYPTKPITLLIPWPAGGITDMIGRTFAKILPDTLGQSVVVVNRPGGAGTIATTECIRARPEGYTTCITAAGPLTTQPHLSDLPYTVDDYIPVIHLGTNPIVLAVRADAPWADARALLNYVRENPAKLRIGHHGAGSLGHLGLIRLQQEAKLSMTPVPFAGAAPAVTALLGGHVEAIAVHPGEVWAQVEAGKARVLAVFQKARNPRYPEAPTMKELGHDIQAGVFNVVLLPKGTPPDVVRTLHDAFKTGLESQTFQGFAREFAYEIEYLDQLGARKRIAEWLERNGELIRMLGLPKKK